MSTRRIPNAEQLKETIRQEWKDGAAGWSKWHAPTVMMGRAMTEALMQAAQIKSGMKVLDLAGGTGEPALSLAKAVGSDGSVIATDLVLEMVAAAEEVARQRGLTNITFQQADAHALPFPDQSLDVVTCRNGVMFFVDVQQALREILRVLKPHGRVVFTAFGPSEHNPHASVAPHVLRKYVQMPPSEAEGPNQFRFAQAGSLSAELHKAGFHQVEEDTRTVPWPWPGSAEEYWQGVQERHPRTRQLIGVLAPERWEQVDAEVLAALAPYDDGKQVNFTACIIVASGVR